jgi:hypothetical protein
MATTEASRKPDELAIVVSEASTCSNSGAMSFHGPESTNRMNRSRLCPEFPKQIELR